MADLEIAKPITLPCGLTLPNRLAKAAMAETWADKEKLPHGRLIETYGSWADGGWGMVLTGNVQVDVTYLGTPDDHAINQHIAEDKLMSTWKQWTDVTNRSKTPTIVQLNHPGRQSMPGAGKRSLFAKTIAPSEVPVKLGDGLIARTISSVVFGTPREMTVADIEHVVKCFATGARLSYEAGFAGIQIHGAHGYLLAQFLSSQTNKRQDDYGGTPRKRARIVVEIIQAIRRSVPKEFCVGIKLNSVDHQSQKDLAECIEQLEEITGAGAGVDFLEVSGGTYENPTMVQGVKADNGEVVSSRTAAREAFFIEFARAIRQHFPGVPLMVTGGFRSREGMESAIKEGACDLIGIGRPAVLDPYLPNRVIFNKELSDNDAKLYAKDIAPSWLLKTLGIRAIGGAATTAWYANRIHYITKKL